MVAKLLCQNGNSLCCAESVKTLDNVELPETGRGLWWSRALARDNSIYYMPFNARRIMRLNPDNDSLSGVGNDLGEGEAKYRGTVVGNDDCVFGIPFIATHIIKFDPSNPASTKGEYAEIGCKCGNGVLGGDGYIYAANRSGQVLQIDTTSNNCTWIGDPIYSSGHGWGGVTLLLELISVFIGLHTMPIVYSSLIPRHNNHHRSWGMTMTWVKQGDLLGSLPIGSLPSGLVELWQLMGQSTVSHPIPLESLPLTQSKNSPRPCRPK